MLADNPRVWFDYMWNPWIGCTRVSPGCDNCAAELAVAPHRHINNWGQNGLRVVTTKKYWEKPLDWNKAAAAGARRPKVYCGTLCDVFEPWEGSMHDTYHVRIPRRHLIPDETGLRDIDEPATMQDVRQQMFALIDETPHLDWMIQTKHPENILSMWDDSPRGFPHKRRDNVCLGVSLENQEAAGKRVLALLKCKELSPLLWLACEPLLGPIDLTDLPNGCNALATVAVTPGPDGTGHETQVNPDIAWVIAGRELGINPRPMERSWAESLRQQCEDAGVPFLLVRGFGAKQGKQPDRRAGE